MWAALANLGNAYAQHRQTSIANDKSQKSATKAFWLDFWAQNYFMDKQNEYNKPINQMKRLEEAGLNPNLVYGSGADTLSAGPAGGGASAVHFSPSKMSLDYIEKKHMLNSMKQQEANIDRTLADTRAVNSNIDIAKAELSLAKAKNDAEIKRINATTNAIEKDSVKKEVMSNFWADPVGYSYERIRDIGERAVMGAWNFGRDMVRNYRNKR